MLLFALTMTALTLADTVQIGTGTDVNVFLPIRGDNAYNYSQQIYTQAQIAKAGSITKLRFYYLSGTITNSKDWVIYMGHTNKVSFNSNTDWAPRNSLTQVFAGDVSSMLPLANNWMEITLDTPFSYNNTDNLIVAVDENTAGSASIYWGSFTSGENTGIYYYSDSNNPNPATPPTAEDRTAYIARVQFEFPTTSAPLAPSLLSPAHNSWSFTDATLAWTATLGGATPDGYDLYFGSSPTPPLVSENQLESSYTPTLSAGSTYYWKVVAKNTFGDSPATATWSFRTPRANQLAESFEGSSFPPTGWENQGGWIRANSNAINGLRVAINIGDPNPLAILSTPKVNISASSTLDLWTLANSSSAVMQILYSADRENWTQLGSNITYAEDYSWYRVVADLSSLAGHSYYLGLRNSSTARARYYVDMVIGPDISVEVPGAAVLMLPADLAENVSEFPTFSWTDAITGSIPNAYKVYCDQSADPSTLLGTTSELSYTPSSPLTFGATYYWKVVPTNAVGDAIGNTIRSFTVRTNPTISSFPYIESFDTLTAPALPPNWTVTEGATGSGVRWDTSTTDADNGAEEAHSGPNFARLNCYWARVNYNPYSLISPALALDASAKRLSYYYWIGTDTVEEPLMVDISTDMTTWTTLYTHSNASNTLAWLRNNIDLSAYASTTVHLRFRGISNYGNAITNLGLDDIVVENIPTTPELSLSPGSINFGSTPSHTATAYTNVLLRNSGAGTLYLSASNISLIGPNANQFSFTTTTGFPAALAAGESVNIPVRFAPNAVGTKTASLRIGYNTGNYDVALSGTMLDLVPLAESFEGATFPPAGWRISNGGGANTWTLRNDTGYPRTGNYAAGITWNATAHNDWLITPALDVRANAASFSFWAKNKSDPWYDQFNVKLSTSTNAISAFTTTLASNVTPGITYTQYSYNLGAYVGQQVYIAVQAISADKLLLLVDDFAGPPIYISPTYPENAISIPHLQSYSAASIPTGWTQSIGGGLTTNTWSVSATANAGGTAFEMRAEYQNQSGISRLISPPIVTTGIGAIQVSFKHFFDDYEPGVTAKLQYSHDLISWMDSPWSHASGTGNSSGNQSLFINGLYAPSTYLAWVLDGNHLHFDHWYIDDLNISEALVAGLDTPELSIAADGSLSWNPVPGADFYTIYGATDPNSAIFTELAITTNLTWLDPTFPAARMFYRISANNNGLREASLVRPAFNPPADSKLKNPDAKPKSSMRLR